MGQQHFIASRSRALSISGLRDRAIAGVFPITVCGDATPTVPDPRPQNHRPRKTRWCAPALRSATRRSYYRDPRRPVTAGYSPTRHAVRDGRQRGTQLPQGAPRCDATGDRFIALRALPPYHPPQGRYGFGSHISRPLLATA